MFFCDCLNVKIQSPDISKASRGNFWPLASSRLIPYESPEEFFKTVRLFIASFYSQIQKSETKIRTKRKQRQRAKEKMEKNNNKLIPDSEYNNEIVN